jgi:hypothetical protein
MMLFPEGSMFRGGLKRFSINLSKIYEQAGDSKDFRLPKGAKPMKHIRNLVDSGDNF